MSSVLSSFFSRDVKTTFPFDLPNESFTTVQSDIFVGKSFRKTDPSEKSTCFWSSTAGGMLKAQAQKLKTLRHPNVLTYIDSLEVNGTFFLITEPCRPLAYYLNENKLTDTQRELFVSWGLYQLLNCLKFLHNEAQISQNNLKNAIFVTESGDWKLTAFHLSGNFSSAQTDLNDMASVLLGIFGDKSAITHSPENALQQIPRRLQPLYKRLCAKGKSVMAVTDMLHESRSVGGFMKNKFVDTLLFLDEFQLREAAERQSFFAQLNQNLDLFPADIARNKILPKLVHVYEYGDAGAHILVPMFKLGRLLQEEEYQQKIVPCLVKLFSSTDRTTRVKLLERIDEFAGHLKPPVVNEKIYSNLVTGFLDSNSAVRESTVKAMVVIADKLNYNNLNTDLMKYLARLQGSDPEPGIRTNTTICLGKIGCYIDPSHRQRILISAFTRALRDPFPPARMAGVIALSATQQYFSLCEVAQKVLPALAPLTVDPEKQVRDQSFKAMSGFLEKLQKASDNPHLIPELEAQVKAGGKGGLLSGDKVPQWAGWAIKAISGKFYKSKESPATETEGTAATTTEVRPPLAQLQTKGGEKESTAEMHSRTASICSSSHSSISARGETTNSSAVADGWGELLDEEEEEERGLEGSEGSSDFGGERRIPKKNNQEREDALWSAAMDSWESTSTPSPNKKAGSLKPNMAVCAPNKLSPPFSLSTTSANEPQQQSPSPAKKSSGFAAMPEKQQKGAALKLGAVKKPAHAQLSKQIDKDLDTLLGMEDTRSSEEKKLDKSVKDGNFASVAKQISQQLQPKPPVQKQQKEKVEGASNWQEW